ncbi:ATP-binding cassette domain-containing protein [Amphibacillus indicireducens]|uniref:ABC transporter domain-containing protein n=1 Tax=Amphibacillus indicireducens TaxID=1076330 RepID=A0ABP7VFY8_9BACI
MEIKNIEKEYNSKVVINDMNLSFPHNGLVFIVGESGSGKSTLLNIMGLLEPNFNGGLHYANIELDRSKKQSNKFLKRYFNFIFQDYNLINSLSVKENIVISVAIAGQNFDELQYQNIIQLLQIDELVEREVTHLSGGEKQRVAIARALLRNNPVILADEPTGNVDQQNSKIIFELLKKISEDHLVIVVSHNERAAYEYGDRIIRISDGNIIEDTDKGYLNNKNLNDKLKREDNEKKRLNSWINTITLNNLKLRKRKMISSFVAMFLCLTFLGIVLGVFNSMNNLVDTINTSVLENDKMTLIDHTVENGYKQIDNEFIEKIKSKDNIVKSVPYYSETVTLSSGKESADEFYATFNVVDYSDFFHERFEDLSGAMISKKNEIILNKSLAMALFPDSDQKYIGEKVVLKTISDMEIECVIVGIRSLDSELSNNELYISSELSDYISSNLINNAIQTIIFKDSSIYPGVYDVDIRTKDSTPQYKIVYGTDISELNEALINIESINELLNIMGVSSSLYSVDDLINNKLSEESIRLIFNTPLLLTGTIERTELAEIKIVGIYKENKRTPLSDLSLIINNEIKESLNRPLYNSLDIYVESLDADKMAPINTIINQFDYNNDEINEGVGFTIYAKLSVLLIIFGLISLIILSISFILINYSTKINIRDRIYEVGVLKSLGASNLFIFKLFVYNNLLLGFSVSLLSVLVLLIVNWLDIIKVSGVSVFNFNVGHMLLIITLGTFVTILAGLRETVAISRMSVVKAISEKHK